MYGSAEGGRLRNGLACICACLAIAVGVPMLLLFNVGQELLQPALVKDALVSQDAYRRLPDLAAQQIAYGTYESSSGQSSETAASDRAFIASVIDSASGSLSACLQNGPDPTALSDLGSALRAATPAESDQVKACLRASGAPSTIGQTVDGMPVFFWMLTESDWHGLLATLLPPDWLRTQVESAIDQFYDLAQSGQSNAPVRISLVDLKTRLSGQLGSDAVTQLIEAQPSCSLDQFASVAAIIASNAPLGQLPVCRPPDAVLTIMAPSIRSALGLLAGLIPDTVAVDLTGASGGAQPNPLVSAHEVLDVTRGVAWAGLGFAILLLLAAIVLGARSVGGAMRWLGVTLAVVGVGELALAGAAQALAHGFVTDRLPSSLSESGIAPGLSALEVDTLNWIVAAFFGRVGVQALVLLAAGLALVGISLVARATIRAHPAGM